MYIHFITNITVLVKLAVFGKIGLFDFCVGVNVLDSFFNISARCDFTVDISV